MDVKAATESLTELGLTRYEAACFSALVELGSSDPRTVAARAGIPSPNTYEALRRLAARGWIELVRRRPAVYRARRPSVVKNLITSRLDETFNALESRFNSSPTEEAELVYTLRGSEAVLSKVYELIERARESVMIVSPAMGLTMNRRLKSLVADAIARGVKVRVITDEEGVREVPTGVDLRTGASLAVDLLVDDKVAMISLPDFSACGWVDSPQVAEQLKQFLELMWRATPRRPA